jgi:hypothetical protein
MIKLFNNFIRMWRCYNMYKQTMGFIKGMGAGIIAGAVVSAVGAQKMKKDRRFKKRADKAMKTVGQVVDNVQYMFK